MEQVKSSFNTLIKTLSIFVPIFTSIIIGLVLGFDQIKIHNFLLSANSAALLSVVILIFLYLQCIRSVRTIKLAVYNNYDQDNYEEFEKIASFLRTESSIFNPF